VGLLGKAEDIVVTTRSECGSFLLMTYQHSCLLLGEVLEAKAGGVDYCEGMKAVEEYSHTLQSTPGTVFVTVWTAVVAVLLCWLLSWQ
jgi:hypothetical protein